MNRTLLAALIVSAAAPLAGSTCEEPLTACHYYSGADYIFIGDLLDHHKVENPYHGTARPFAASTILMARFRVVSVIKGDPPAEVAASTWNTIPPRGGRFLIFVRRAPDNGLMLTLGCDNLRDPEEYEAYTRQLRTIHEAPADHTWVGGVVDYPVDTDTYRRFVPIPHIEVAVSDWSVTEEPDAEETLLRTIRVKTDRTGRYQTTFKPQGTEVRVQAEAAGRTIYESTFPYDQFDKLIFSAPDPDQARCIELILRARKETTAP